MKKLFAGIITCATILLTGIGVSAAAADENNSGDENVQSEIVFCIVNSEQTGRTAYSYGGFFIESNGNIRTFSFENIEENFTFNAYWDVFRNAPKSIMLNESIPHDKLLSHLNDNISEYKIVGNISKEEYASKASLLSEINLNAEIPFVPFQTAGMTSYTESFGVRYDNDDNAQIVFMNGHVSGDMKYRTYLENSDEKSIELNNWLIEKCKSFMSSEPITTTAPTTPDATTTTTVTTTITAEPDTEQTTEVPKIEFCQVEFILDYEKYYGIFLDSNRNVYSFLIDNVTENWNLYGAYSNSPIKLTDSMPQDGLLTYLYDHFDEWKFIGKTSEDDYTDYKNELNQIDLNTEMAYRLYAEPDVVGLSHTETFAVRYDENGNRQIVFLSGGLSIQYEHYLKNPDKHAIALNSKMIKYEEISDPVTAPDEITDQTTTASTTPDATTTTTVTTIVTDETNTEQTTAPPTTDTGNSVSTETSTVPPTTTTGTETTLPQTGYSKWYQALIAAAMGMIGVGSTAIVRSGIFRKKESNS